VSGNGTEAPASTTDDKASTPTDPLSKLSAKIWRAATSAANEAVKTEIMQGEDLETILRRMSEAQKERLFDRLVAHRIRQAKVMSKSVDDMLTSITGTFWHMASQDDPAKVVEAMAIIKGKLAKRQLSAKDIKFAVAKRERVISPAAMAAAQAAREKINQRKKRLHLPALARISARAGAGGSKSPSSSISPAVQDGSAGDQHLAAGDAAVRCYGLRTLMQEVLDLSARNANVNDDDGRAYV
jgi:hypothetical protein